MYALALLLVLASAVVGSLGQCVPPTAPFNASNCPSVPPSGSPTPVCVAPNDTSVQEILAVIPNCVSLLDQLAISGEGVWLPDDPAGPAWQQGYKAGYIGAATSGYALARTLGMVGVLPVNRDCVHAFLRFQCSQIFKACDLTSPFVFPRAPCFESCDLMDTLSTDPSGTLTCSAVIKGFIVSPSGFNQSLAVANRLLPSCDRCESGCAADGSNPYIYGNASFPVFPGGQTWALPGISVPVQCAAYPVDLFVQNNGSRELFPCYGPWVKAPKAYDNYCGLGCPLQMFPLYVYDGLAIMIGILGWISYIVSFLVSATMVWIPRYRRVPGLIILILCIGAHIESFGFLFIATHGYKDVTCKDAITYNEGSNAGSACVFQTLSFTFASNVVSFAWATIAVNSVISIGLQKSSLFQNKMITIVQLAIIIGWPIVACIIVLAMKDKIAGRPLSPVCFLTGSLSSAHPRFTSDFIISYIPLGICILVAVPCITFTFVQLRHLQDAAKSRIARQIRVALFLFIFLAIWSFVFAARFWSMVRGDKWGADFAEYYVGPSVLAPTEPTPRHLQPSRGIIYGSMFVFSIQGLLIGLLFGTNKDVLHFWRERFANVKAGRSFFSGLTSASTSKEKESSIRGSSAHEHHTMGATTFRQ